MPSLKSLFVLGVAALSAFAFPAPATGEGLVARSDAITPIVARAVEVPRAPLVEPLKREPEALIARGGSTLPDIFAECQSGLDGIKTRVTFVIDITVNGTVKVDVNILVGIVLQIKALIDVCVANIQAIVGLGLNVILTVQLTVFLNIVVQLIVTVVACLKLCINACVSVDLHLVLDACAQVDVALTACLNVLASLILGLSALLVIVINLTVGLVADLHAVALFNVCAFLGI